MLREVLDVIDYLDNPAAGAAGFEKMLAGNATAADKEKVDGPHGTTEFVSYVFGGHAGKSNGGTARTLGIIGSLGGLRLPGKYVELNSDADGCLVALACALRLARMRSRGMVLAGDVVITTHICQQAHPEPHDPLPFVMPPMPVDEVYARLVDPAMDAILSVETCKGNRMMSQTGFAITPVVKEGYIMRVHQSLLHVMDMVTTRRARVFPISMQDITPFGNDIHHVCGMMLPANHTDAPCVGVAITAEMQVVPAFTGVFQVNDLEAAGRFCIEVAATFGNGDAEFYYEDDFAALSARYGSMKHLVKN